MDPDMVQAMDPPPTDQAPMVLLTDLADTDHHMDHHHTDLDTDPVMAQAMVQAMDRAMEVPPTAQDMEATDLRTVRDMEARWEATDPVTARAMVRDMEARWEATVADMEARWEVTEATEARWEATVEDMEEAQEGP
jgi:hypothetical protein